MTKEHENQRPAGATSNPALTGQSGACSEPGAESQSISNLISLTLISKADQGLCNFWVGFYRPGSESPGKLLEVNCLLDLMEKAAKEGLKTSEPVMLSDVVSEDYKRFIYLSPPPGSSEEVRSRWVGSLTDTIQAWGPGQVGLGVSPALLKFPDDINILKEILISLITGTECRNFYLLVGDSGANAILNAALALKPEIKNAGFQLSVFH